MKIILFLISFSFLFASETVNIDKLEALKTTDKNFQYVYLVRHGESIYNLPDENGMFYTQGQSVSSPLTKNGKKQALKIAKILQKKIPLTTKVIVASSTAIRATDTAYNIFKALSKKCNTKLGGRSKGLLEIAKGKWEGLPKNEAFQKEFNLWKKLSAYDQWKTPQVTTAESLDVVANRATKSINKIIYKYPNKTLFIVTHGGVLLCLENFLNKTELSKDPSSNFPKSRYSNCDMILLKIPKGKNINHATIEAYIKSGFPKTYK
jgi:broad specificity phosphatase PhoE